MFKLWECVKRKVEKLLRERSFSKFNDGAAKMGQPKNF